MISPYVPVLDNAVLANLNFCVGTPMFGGMCHGAYTSSLIDLQGECYERNVNMRIQTVYGESLVQRARNNIVDAFLKTNADYLVFIDADIEFRGSDVLHLVQIASNLMRST